MRSKHTVIILGNLHSDFTLFQPLERLFKKMHRDKIPCAFLEEVPGNRNLHASIEATAKQILGVSNLKSMFPEITQSCARDCNGIHFTNADTTRIANILQTKLFQPKGITPEPGVLEQTILEISRGNEDLEKIKFYNALKILEVYYSGIDLPDGEYQKRALLGTVDATIRAQNESLRIAAMVNNIFNTIHEFSLGGVLIVSVGISHARRLGANLLLEQAKMPNKDLRLNIQVFDCFSNYVQSDLEDVSDYLEGTLKLDSPEIKEIYKILPWRRTKIEVDGTRFSIPVLEKFVNTILPPGQIRLFDINRPSRELIEETMDGLYTLTI